MTDLVGPRKPHPDAVELLRARIRATAPVQPELSRALVRILDMWETSDRVLKAGSVALPHWSGGRNSALVDVVNALALGYGLPDEEQP